MPLSPAATSASRRLDNDRLVALFAAIGLFISGLLAIVFHIVNNNVVAGQAEELGRLRVQPDFGLGYKSTLLIVPALLIAFIVPGITALVASFKRTVTTRVVHIVFVSIGLLLASSMLVDGLGSMYDVNSYDVRTLFQQAVAPSVFCAARSTRIAHAVFTAIGLLLVIAHLIYSGVIFCLAERSNGVDTSSEASSSTKP